MMLQCQHTPDMASLCMCMVGAGIAPESLIDCSMPTKLHPDVNAGVAPELAMCFSTFNPAARGAQEGMSRTSASLSRQ